MSRKQTPELRPGASVKWSRRSTSNEEYFSTHYDGPYKVEVCEQDGDLCYWHVWIKGEDSALAHGELPELCKTDRDIENIAKDIAIAALRAIQAKRLDTES